jgi:hypothetical protein
VVEERKQVVKRTMAGEVGGERGGGKAKGRQLIFLCFGFYHVARDMMQADSGVMGKG